MALSKRKEIIYILCAVIAVLSAGVVHYFSADIPAISLTATAFLYFSIIIFWELVVRHRMVWVEIRRHMTATAFLMLLWVFIQTVFSAFTGVYPAAARLLSYLYFPILSAIFCEGLLATICVSQNASFKMSIFYRAVHFPGLLLSSQMIRNDIAYCRVLIKHGLEITSIPSMYGIERYLIILWLLVIMSGIFAHIAVRAKKKNSLKQAACTLIILLIGYAVSLQSIIYGNAFYETFIRTPELICILVMLFWLLFINMGVVPSNRDYIAFFENFTTPAVLADNAGSIRIESRTGNKLTKELVEQMGELPDITIGSKHIHKRSVPGGYIAWEDDISEILEYNRRIEELTSVLGEADQMAEALDNVKNRQEEVLQRDKIYTEIFASIQHVVMLVEQRLDHLRSDDKKYDHHVKYLCILTAFMKRRCNMLLISADRNTLDIQELRYCLAETAHFMELYGTDFGFNIDCEGAVSARVLISVYDCLHAIFYASLPNVNALLLNVFIRDGALTARINIDSDVFNEIYYPHLDNSVCITEETEGGTKYVTITYLQWKGECV